MSVKIERRFVTTEVRLSDGSDDQALLGSVSGYAAMYYNGNDRNLSQPIGRTKAGILVRERLASGCFTRVLSKNPDVQILFNHDPNLILGRTSSGTARVGESPIGLHFSCNLGKQSYAQDLRESIRRGDVNQCSFGFVVDPDDGGEEDWTKETDSNGDLYACRTIKHVSRLLDCSPVTYPAYKSTMCGTTPRSLFPDGQPEYLKRTLEQYAIAEAQSSFARSQRSKFIDSIIGE
jgi:HK97 family phage prohead protease